MDFDKLFKQCGFVLLYLAVALIAGCIVTGLLVWFFKREKFGDFKKYAIGIATGFAVCALTLMTYLTAQGNKADGKAMDNLTFIPIIVEISIAVAGMVAILICSLFGKKAVKIAGLSTGVLLLGGFIAIMVCMSKYYESVQSKYQIGRAHV